MTEPLLLAVIGLFRSSMSACSGAAEGWRWSRWWRDKRQLAPKTAGAMPGTRPEITRKARHSNGKRQSSQMAPESTFLQQPILFSGRFFATASRPGERPGPIDKIRPTSRRLPLPHVWNAAEHQELVVKARVGWHPSRLHSNMAFFAGKSLPHSEPDRPVPTSQHQEQAVAARSPSGAIIETDIPARLDALPFSRFHVRVIVALGITWILDGLEVTLAGALSGELKSDSALALTNTQVGLAGSCYIAGAVLGAFLFGWLTDRLGRKRLFTVTVVVYLLATGATAGSWNFWSFALFRFFTGAGIGGEYTAINSTIQELTPARLRGWTDLVINGSFWFGAAMGAGASIVLLDPRFVNPALGWRLAFLIGATIGLVIVIMRLWIPESPRWLVTHGLAREADRIVSGIEAQLGLHHRHEGKRIRLRARHHTPLLEVGRTLFVTYRRRTLVGLSLMAAQAFFYNAIFFTYALVLMDFYHTPADRIGWYILPFAAGNVLGPILLGRLFDTIGRKIMIASTYALSGLLLAVTAYLFSMNLLSANQLTVAWMTVFFFASTAASSAYLTVSEIFPLELRALAIAFFYAIGTGLGGIVGPLLLGMLINTGSRGSVAIGYCIGAALMLAAAGVQALWGVAAERQPLEAVSRPLALLD